MAEIIKYKLKNPSFFTTKKDGTAYIDKNGKPFRRASFKVKEYGENFVYGNVFDPKIDWKDGDEVELIITEGEYKGQKSISFEIPQKNQELLMRIEKLENAMTLVKLKLKEHESKLMPDKPSNVVGTNIDYPEMVEEPDFGEDGLDQIKEENL